MASLALRNAGMSSLDEGHGRHALPAEQRKVLLNLAGLVDDLLAVLVAGAVTEVVAELGGAA